MPIKVRKGYAPAVARQQVPGIYMNPNIPADAFGIGFGQALSQLGASVQKYQEKQEAVNMSETAANFSDTVYNLERDLLDGRRTAPIDQQNLFAQQESRIDNTLNKFLSTVDPQLQSRYGPTIAETKAKFKLSELEHQNKRTGVYFKDRISKVANEQFIRVQNDPSLYDEAMGTLNNQIDLSGLSEPEKFAERTFYEQKLQAIKYGSVYKDELTRDDRWIEQSQFAGQIIGTEGTANPKRYQDMKPEARQGFRKISSIFGEPLRITPSGGVRYGGSKTSRHYRDRRVAMDIKIDDYPDEKKTRLIATAIANGVRGIGGYGPGAPSGFGTVHFDFREEKGAGPGNLGLWWRHKSGKNASWTTAPEWFQQGIIQGLEARRSGKYPAGYNRTNLIDRIIGVESGNRAGVEASTSSAMGWSQALKGTWREFIAARHGELITHGEDIYKYRSNKEMSREFVGWYLGVIGKKYRTKAIPINDATLYLGYVLGPTGGSQLMMADPSTPVSEILSAGAINANKSFLKGKTAGEVQDWAAEKMHQKVVHSQIDTDPRFAGLDYETRMDIRSDVESFVRAQELEADKIFKERKDQILNEAFISARLGTDPSPRQTMQQLMDDGILTEYSDITKYLTAIKAHKEELDDGATFQSFMSGESTYNRFDSDHKKAMNVGGKALIPEINNQNNEVLPAMDGIAQRTGGLPPNAMDALIAATENANWQTARWALDTLKGLEELHPQIVHGLLRNDDIRERVQSFGALSEVLAPEELQAAMKPLSMKDRAKVKALDEDVSDYIKNEKITVEDIAANFETLWPGSTSDIRSRSTGVAIFEDWEALFRNYYKRTENFDTATELANAHLLRMWGWSDTSESVMKYPPELYAPNYLGDKEWIKTQLYSESKTQLDDFAEGDSFILSSDEQTHREVNANASPTYLVTRVREDGLREPIIGWRWGPKKTEDMYEAERLRRANEASDTFDMEERLRSDRETQQEINRRRKQGLEKAEDGDEEEIPPVFDFDLQKRRWEEEERRRKIRQELLEMEQEAPIDPKQREPKPREKGPDDLSYGPPSRQGVRGWQPDFELGPIKLGGDPVAYRKYRRRKKEYGK